jgi:6-phosphogluconolactonase
MDKANIQVYQDLEVLSQYAADAVIEIAQAAISRDGIFTIALTGGGTVVNLYKNLSSEPRVNQVEWDKAHFFWGDERMVPPNQPESNYAQAKMLFLREVGVRPENVHRIRGELSSNEAVDDYLKQLREHAAPDLDWPTFDLVLFGMGSDGHMASIFPGEITEAELQSPVIATTADYEGRPAERISLTPLLFNTAKNIFFLVSGRSKAANLAKVFLHKQDPVQFPVHRLRPRDGKVTWFLDQAAASQIPDEILLSMTD